MGIGRTSAGDPARTLELLWREHGGGRQAGKTTRGPKQSFTVDQVVDAAIELADSEGLGAVTMRRVAQKLGVAPMSVYTYVPGKAELLDLMVDRVYARMSRRPIRSRSWRSRVKAIADDNMALFREHPWLAEVANTRPTLGPGVMAKYEYELAAFDGLGLDDVEMDAALTHLMSFVQSCARMELEAAAAASTSGMSDEEWWRINEPLLSRIFDAKAYPLAARVGSAAGAAHGGAVNPSYAYEFGLRCVLDGFEALIQDRKRRQQSRRGSHKRKQ